MRAWTPVGLSGSTMYSNRTMSNLSNTFPCQSFHLQNGNKTGVHLIGCEG